MKTYKKQSFVFLFLLFAISTVTYSGPKIKDVIISGLAASEVKLELVQYGPYFISGSTRYTIESKNGLFSLPIPGITQPCFISARISYKNGVRKNIIMDRFLVEPGDSVYIDIRQGQPVFSGKSGGTFSCQYAISEVIIKGKGINLMEIRDFYTFLKNDASLFDSIHTIKQNILASYRPVLSAAAYLILQAEYNSQKSTPAYKSMDFYMSIMMKYPERQEGVVHYYQDHYSGLWVDTTNAVLLAHSVSYVEYLLAKARLELLMQRKQYPTWKESLLASAVFNYINLHYAGLLKERLLAGYFAAKLSFDDSYDSLNTYLTKSIQLVSEPHLKNTLIETQRKTKGVPAYDFSLPDSTGTISRLSDYRGKVVIMDFWYTGCSWCIVLAKKIKPVSAAYRNHPGVAFISVSIDTDKNRWKQSLQGGEYTSEEEINLYTNGKGHDDPMIQYYRFTGYPQLLIIDANGKIFSVNPHFTGVENFQLKPYIEKLMQAGTKE